MRTFVLTAAAAAILAGCNPATPPPPEPAPGAVKVADATFDSLDKAIKAHKGQVVLVDFWATWCPPCVEKFPNFVALHTRYSAEGLRCVSVSIDKSRDDMAVLAFLQEKRAAIENYHWKTWQREEKDFTNHFQFAGGIPHMVAYARSGERVWDSSSQPLSKAGLDELVQNLLAAQ
jgi:thiol-disulfide isomerase/thioredoxin